MSGSLEALARSLVDDGHLRLLVPTRDRDATIKRLRADLAEIARPGELRLDYVADGDGYVEIELRVDQWGVGHLPHLASDG